MAKEAATMFVSNLWDGGFTGAACLSPLAVGWAVASSVFFNTQMN